MSEFCNIAIGSRPYHCEEMTVDGSRVDLVRCDVPYRVASLLRASGRPVQVSVGTICLDAFVIGICDGGQTLELDRIGEPWAVSHQRLDWPETVKRIRNG